MTVFMLPIPPSVNELTQNTRNRRTGKSGRARSDVYAAWITEAGWVLKMQKPPGLVTLKKYEIAMTLGASGMDLDNSIKAVNDLLQAHRIIENDKLVQRVLLEWDVARIEPRTVKVEIKPWVS